MDEKWNALLSKLKELLGKDKVSTEGILMLVGLRELGLSPESLSKEEKYNLIHVGMCAILCQPGYYQLERRDDEGWPHYELLKPLPAMDIFQQAAFLREHILGYFSLVYSDL
jgi:hypothetical protein